MCIDYIKTNIKIKTDLIIEDIKLLSDNYEFYDLEPENDEIIQQNYLLYKNKIHIIGNPQFGCKIY